MKLIRRLSTTPMILASFVLMNVFGFGFSFVQQAVGGELLDMIWNGQDAQGRLLEMSAEQKSTHLYATLVLDTLYPLAYGAFFLGLTARLAPGNKIWWFIPALGAMVFDLLENASQVLGLAGHTGFLNLKDVFTPAKFGFVMAAAGLLILLILIALYRKVAGSK